MHITNGCDNHIECSGACVSVSHMRDGHLYMNIANERRRVSRICDNHLVNM